MSITLRKELSDVKRIVVKVGSNVVTKASGQCDLRTLRIIVEDICELADSGLEVVLVSSGAVSIGKAFLRKHQPDSQVDLDQSASSIGQPKLINKYSSLFSENGRICSQILLTHDDFRRRKRFNNAKRTIEVLLKNKIVPILNENDSISYQEITVGDNDHLAAQTAHMVDADALLVITSAQGLFDRDPSEPTARLINRVEFGQDLTHIDMSLKTATGRGGMASKVEAISKATQLGIRAIVSSKDNPRIILDPLTQNLGTLFDPKKSFNSEKKAAWLVSTKRTRCCIEVTAQGRTAILKGESLGPLGVLAATGEFFRGDCVDIRYQRKVFAFGLAEYNRSEVDQIKGQESDKIEGALGYRTSSEVIHNSNLVVNEVSYDGKIRTELKGSSEEADESKTKHA